MICRSCGAKIADKAIVCYRCGTPTADLPPVTPASAARASKRRGFAGILTAVVLMILAAVTWWRLPGLATDPEHLALAVSVVLLSLYAVVRLLRSRR